MRRISTERRLSDTNQCSLHLHRLVSIPSMTQCLKITQKVAFNIVSEASLVYILVDKSYLNDPFRRVFENSVTRQVIFKGTKIGEKCLN